MKKIKTLQWKKKIEKVDTFSNYLTWLFNFKLSNLCKIELFFIWKLIYVMNIRDEILVKVKF